MRYANLMPTLAMFVALGGTSYATMTVTGEQIKDNTRHRPRRPQQQRRIE